MLTHDPSELLAIGTLMSGSVDIEYWATRLTADCFSDVRLQTTFRAMLDLLEAGQPINLFSIETQLQAAYPQVHIDHSLLVDALMEDQPHNMPQAVALLHDCRLRRRLIELSKVIAYRAESDNTTVNSVVEYLQAAIDQLDVDTSGHGLSLQEVAPMVRQRIDDNLHPETRHLGPLTGIRQLDHEAPLPETGLVILGGFTSHGKSAFANLMALTNARGGKPVAIFSKEMTNLETVARMTAMGTTSTSASRIMSHPLTTEQYRQATLSLDQLQQECGERIFFDDSRSLQIDDLTASIRHLHKEQHIAVAFVDYLQLLSHDVRRQNTTQEWLVAHYSRTLKNLADRLGICIVALSQLNRNMQQQRPNLSVIRDSGQIAEAADYVLFVWRPAVNRLPYDGDFASCDTTESALLIVGKNRQGPTLDTLIGWRPTTTLFYDLTPEQLELIRHGQRPTLAQRAVQGVLFE